jgi:CubicO group peptidase (beta-lactamase class C family)
MMQTSNMDIRGVQFLNNINRTIDALNQVRLSAYGVVTPNTFGFNPAVGGLAHAGVQSPFVTGQWSQWGNQYMNPYTYAYANAVTNPLTNPYAQLANTGLGHSAWGSGYDLGYGYGLGVGYGSPYADPYATAYIGQVWGYSPFGW